MSLRLDLTDPASVAHAADVAVDVYLLVNNAAIAPEEDTSVLTGDEDVMRRILDTNVFGTLQRYR